MGCKLLSRLRQWGDQKICSLHLEDIIIQIHLWSAQPDYSSTRRKAWLFVPLLQLVIPGNKNLNK